MALLHYLACYRCWSALLGSLYPCGAGLKLCCRRGRGIVAGGGMGVEHLEHLMDTRSLWPEQDLINQGS